MNNIHFTIINPQHVDIHKLLFYCITSMILFVVTMFVTFLLFSSRLTRLDNSRITYVATIAAWSAVIIFWFTYFLS